MAEGIINHELGDNIEALSAGTTPISVNPRAILIMKEVGIDISGHRSKNMEEFTGFFQGVKKIHTGFDDPAATTGTEEEIMAVFRKV